MATRTHVAEFHCPNCKTWVTAETEFGRWIRDNRELDASKGYSVSDQDYIIHRFKTYRGRIFQILIEVEIKTMGAKPSDAQLDTLHIKNQLVRNRRETPTKENKFQAGSAPLQAYSTLSKRMIWVRHYGVHLLTFSHLGPKDSEWIKWDKTRVSEQQLTDLLKCELDPDTLRPLDLRSHHQREKTMKLPLGDI